MFVASGSLTTDFCFLDDFPTGVLVLPPRMFSTTCFQYRSMTLELSLNQVQ